LCRFVSLSCLSDLSDAPMELKLEDLCKFHHAEHDHLPFTIYHSPIENTLDIMLIQVLHSLVFQIQHILLTIHPS